MTTQWYVLRSKPNKEDVLYRQVLLRGFEAFYPCQTLQSTNSRSRKSRAFFTSYMFVHINLQETGLSTFQWMPYSSGLVNFDGEPAAIPSNIMNALIKGIETHLGNEAAIRNEFIHGDALKVVSGPFTGYEAIFDMRLPGNDRIRILLSLAKGNRMPVELPTFHVERKMILQDQRL
jgi:transcriptional antiterminator RfaH